MSGRQTVLLIAVPFLLLSVSLASRAAESDILWPQVPIRIDKSKQHYQRLPAVPVAIDKRTWLSVSGRIQLLDSTRFKHNGTVYRIADIQPVQAKRICKNVEGGRWTCGRMGVVLLSNLVFNKRLLCDVVAGAKETVLNRCLSGRIDVSREILVRGLGHVDHGNPLMPYQIEAQKAAAGLWRNPDCKRDFDRC